MQALHRYACVSTLHRFRWMSTPGWQHHCCYFQTESSWKLTNRTWCTGHRECQVHWKETLKFAASPSLHAKEKVLSNQGLQDSPLTYRINEDDHLPGPELTNRFPIRAYCRLTTMAPPEIHKSGLELDCVSQGCRESKTKNWSSIRKVEGSAEVSTSALTWMGIRRAYWPFRST